MTSQTHIQEFLRQKRFAFIGVSRDERDFSRILFHAFLSSGYDIAPVNPGTVEIEGRKCFGSIQDVTPRVTSALLMLPRQSLTRLILQCAEAGVTLIWIYGIMGPRGVPPPVLTIGAEQGISIIPGYCPFMFFKNAGMLHRVHRALMRFAGMMPK
ncbi:MAG: hypothetical protein HBSIN02_06650 [Bacteroidia bacterium]|nr:MAG: hypothetical protein HBSIN02_06650 [Bacteroidia bacterium]